jgi:hypothetical protein
MTLRFGQVSSMKISAPDQAGFDLPSNASVYARLRDYPARGEQSFFEADPSIVHDAPNRAKARHHAALIKPRHQRS